MNSEIPEKQTKEYPLGDLREEQFLVLATEVIKELDWELISMRRWGFVVYPNSYMVKLSVIFEGYIARITCEWVSEQIIDTSLMEKSMNAFLDVLHTKRQQFSPDQLTSMYESIQPLFSTSESEEHEGWGGVENHSGERREKKSFSEKMAGFSSLFILRKGYTVTPILMNINIGIFILMAIAGANILQPDTETLLRWGANFRPLTLSGEPWRLVTSCFLHIGILHLLMNMYALLIIGTLLEPRLGTARFLSAYLLTGIVSSTASLWWHINTISAGASGAIFGMYGVFIALLTTNIVDQTSRKKLLPSMAMMVIFNLAYGMKSGIDNSAHIGGLISGIIIGYAMTPGLRESATTVFKYSVIAIISVIVLSGSFIVYKKLPNDFAKYDAVMKKVSDYEQTGLKIFKMPPNSTQGVYLTTIKDTCLPAWNKAKAELDGTEKLNVPDLLHDRARLLVRYCDFRILMLDLTYRQLNGDTLQYEDRINEYNDSIKAIIEMLKE